ncbi:hypothetical protein CHS0354_027927, partial [Potamilus streckersoni]
MEAKSPAISEAPSTRLAREKLKAISEFLPVHERLKEKLQQRQQVKTDILEGNLQTFAPITAGIKTALYGDPDDAFKRDDKKPISDLLKEISSNVKQAPKQTVAIEQQTEEEQQDEDEQIAGPSRKKDVKFVNLLTEEATNKIRNIDLLKPEEYEAFGTYMAEQYYTEKDKYLKDEYKNKKVNINKWADNMYKIQRNISTLTEDKKRTAEYERYIIGIELGKARSSAMKAGERAATMVKKIKSSESAPMPQSGYLSAEDQQFLDSLSSPPEMKETNGEEKTAGGL